MENFYLQAVVDDLRPRLVGATLGRVWQPDETTLVLDLRADDGRLLLLSPAPQDPSLFLTSRPHGDFERGSGAERSFAALVRKRLRGGRLESIEKVERDRVVTLVFAAYDADGSVAAYRLVAELTGRSSNVYLVDDASSVLGTLRPLPETGVLERDEPRTAPNDDRPTLAELAGTEIAPEVLDAPQRAIAGVGPTLAEELRERARRDGAAAAVASLARDLAVPVTRARLYVRPMGKRLVLATFPLVSAAGAAERVFDDPSRAADERARLLADARRVEAVRQALRSRVTAALDKARRLVRALEGDVASAEGHERDRELGESLLAQVTSAERVEGGFSFVDYYSEDQRKVVVPADRGDTPQQVADWLFARHRKAKRTKEQAAGRLVAARERLDRVSEIAGRLDAATTDEEIEAVESDVAALFGLRRAASGVGRKKAEERTVAGARRFVSSDGFEILVGRSSSANDYITFKVARSSDVWLHAADYPGSHVVVRNAGRPEVPHRTVLEAAQLAAFYSEAGRDNFVEVRYTQRKFVSKPRGAPPGAVRIGRFKTLSVRPAADLDRAE